MTVKTLPQAVPRSDASPADAAPKPPAIQLTLHVLPLLEAICWMGQASHKLSEVRTVEEYDPAVKQALAGLIGPDGTNAGEHLSSLGWLAGHLLRRYMEETGAE